MPSAYEKLCEALSPERNNVRPLIPTHRRDDLIDTAQHYGRTIIFALGVVKAAELVFKKRFL